MFWWPQKFTSQLMGYDVLTNLESDVEDIHWTHQDGSGVAHEFCLFSLEDVVTAF